MQDHSDPTSSGPTAPASAGGRHRSNRLAALPGLFALLFVVAVVIFLVQNGAPVRVSFLVWTVRAPLWLTTFVAAGGAGLFTAALLVTRRGRR